MAPNPTPHASGGIAGRLRHLIPNRRHAALTIAVEFGLALTGMPPVMHLTVGVALEALIVLAELPW